MSISLFARRAGLLTVTLAVLVASSAALRAQGADPVVAKVDGMEIRQSDLDVAEAEAGQLPPMSEAAKKDYLVQFTADMMLVSKAAEAKFGKDDAFKQKLEFARKKLLMEELLQSTGKEALTDAAMRQVYDDAIKQMSSRDRKCTPATS